MIRGRRSRNKVSVGKNRMIGSLIVIFEWMNALRNVKTIMFLMIAKYSTIETRFVNIRAFPDKMARLATKAIVAYMTCFKFMVLIPFICRQGTC